MSHELGEEDLESTGLGLLPLAIDHSEAHSPAHQIILGSLPQIQPIE